MPTRVLNLGFNGELQASRRSIVAVDIAHSELGDRVERRYLAVNDKPTLHTDGYHRVTQTIDAYSNVTEGAYFGVDEEPLLHRHGFHRYKQEVDGRGNLNEWAYFGVG